MSVALRGSPRGGLGTLRRTASLEYFLDCDKNCEEEEVELKPSHTIMANTKPVSYPTSSQAKVRGIFQSHFSPENLKDDPDCPSKQNTGLMPKFATAI